MMERAEAMAELAMVARKEAETAEDKASLINTKMKMNTNKEERRKKNT